MTQECRQALEAAGFDYQGTMNRMMNNEQLMDRFLGKFLNDGSMGALREALAAGNGEGAFVAAHTLKGVAGNLGLTGIYNTVVPVVEPLRRARDGKGDLADMLAQARQALPALEQAYQGVAQALAAYQA